MFLNRIRPLVRDQRSKAIRLLKAALKPKPIAGPLDRVDQLSISGGPEISFLTDDVLGGRRYRQLSRDVAYLRDQSSGVRYEQTKEPETVAWLDRLPRGEVFWDIGANVGTYSLYAAVQRDMRVVSFEPQFGNFFALNHNILLTGCDSQVKAFCLAFSSKTEVSDLHSPRTGIGQSGSQIGQAKNDRDERFQPVFTQGGLSITLDNFVQIFSPPIPVAIKIDVDGVETEILRGAESLLSNPALKFLSVEMNDHRPGPRDEVLSRLSAVGFELAGKFTTTKYLEDGRNFNFHFSR